MSVRPKNAGRYRAIAAWLTAAALAVAGLVAAPPAAAAATPPQFDMCPGNGTDGYRVQALFGYSSSPGELDNFRARIDAANRAVTTTFGVSSLERVTATAPYGLEQLVRWNCPTDTVPDIKTFAAGDPATRTYSSIVAAAGAAGFNAANRDYVIYIDSWNDFACGRGGLPGTVAAPGARYSVSSAGCGYIDSGRLYAGATNHEVGHTLGPNHVWDAGGYSQTMARTNVACPTTAYEETFDCNYNDYYDPQLPSSMAATVNVANSPYLTVPVVRPRPFAPVYLSDLEWLVAVNGYGPVERNRSNGEASAGDGRAITLNGKVYPKGLGAHAYSDIRYNLAGRYTRFRSDVGVDDEMTGWYESVVFEVWVDGVKRFDSGKMTTASTTRSVSIDVTGGQQLWLIIRDAGDGTTGDHGDWASARLTPS